MRRLRGLLVDDDPRTAVVIEQTLEFEFDSLGRGVDWTVCECAGDARTAVKDLDFDFAVIDLYLSEDEPDGLAVVKALRRKNERTFVLVVTGWPERNQNFRDDAAEVGANHAVYRRSLFQTTGRWSASAVVKLILDHLAAVGLVEVGPITYDEEDPGIRSVLEAVGSGAPDGDHLSHGKRILRNLATRCLEDSFTAGANLHLSYLAPGRSGAHVCRVDLSATGQPTESFVIKFGLDRGALERERRANAQASRVLRQQALVTTVGEVQTDVSGYSAIAARLADAAIPLADWLVESASVDQAGEVASVLFRDQLNGLTHAQLPQWRPALDWTRSSALYQVRARAALARYFAAARHPQAGGRFDAGRRWRLLGDFVQSGHLPVSDPNLVPEMVPYLMGFGDLHSSNVLVQLGTRPTPVLVDASLYAPHHWAADSARLLVDVFLRVRQTGVSAMLWSNFFESLRASTYLCPLRPLPSDDATTAPDAFIRQVCQELPEYVLAILELGPQQWHWQWHVALAKEFVRQAASPGDLAPTRAVLALVAAGHHLRTGIRLLGGAATGSVQPIGSIARLTVQER